MARFVGRQKAETKSQRSVGRPARFTPQLAERICGLIATGSTLRAAAKACGVGWRTVARWNVERPAFREAYEHARETRTLVWAEECLDIVDDTRGDYVDNPKTGRREFNRENVLRAKLRVDERHWQMARLDPRLWGDRQQIDVKDDLALMTPDERERKALQLLDMMDAWLEQKRRDNSAIEEIKYDPGEPGDLNPFFRPKKVARPEPPTIDQTSPNESTWERSQTAKMLPKPGGIGQN